MQRKTRARFMSAVIETIRIALSRANWESVSSIAFPSPPELTPRLAALEVQPESELDHAGIVYCLVD